MEQIDVFKAKIVRPHANVSWGFRLEGGAEHGLPLKVHRVSPGSPAHQIGITSNDVITEIGDVRTDRLTYNQAHELIAQSKDTILLTIERKARGSVPTNPLVSHPQRDNPKSYQTYDMSGAKKPAPQYQQQAPPLQMSQPHTRPQEQDPTRFYQTYDLNGPKTYTPPSMQRTNQYNSADFPTAQSRPFQSPPRSYGPPAQAQAVPSPTTVAPQSPGFSQGVKYIPEEEKVGGDVSQSKTFKILQSLMQNDEPYSGVAGLPPPRSLEQERWKEDYARQHPGARVKVFVPQKYNSPMDLYSAPNVVDSFQQQATGYFDEMESQERQATVHEGVGPNVVFRSKTAQAVYAEDLRQQRSQVMAKRASQMMEEIKASPIEERPAGSLQAEIARRRAQPDPVAAFGTLPPGAAYPVPPAVSTGPERNKPVATGCTTVPFQPQEQPMVHSLPEPPKPLQKPSTPGSVNHPAVESQFKSGKGKAKRVRPPPGPEKSIAGVQYGPVPDYVPQDDVGMSPDYVEQTVEHCITIAPQKAEVPRSGKSGAEVASDVKKDIKESCVIGTEAASDPKKADEQHKSEIDAAKDKDKVTQSKDEEPKKAESEPEKVSEVSSDDPDEKVAKSNPSEYEQEQPPEKKEEALPETAQDQSNGTTEAKSQEPSVEDVHAKKPESSDDSGQSNEVRSSEVPVKEQPQANNDSVTESKESPKDVESGKDTVKSGDEKQSEKACSPVAEADQDTASPTSEVKGPAAAEYCPPPIQINQIEVEFDVNLPADFQMPSQFYIHRKESEDSGVSVSSVARTHPGMSDF